MHQDQTSPVRDLFAEAIAHHQAGRLPDAIGCYRQVLALRPDLVPAHNNLGTALSEMGSFVEAESQYRQALALQPGAAEAHNNLGTVLADLDRLDEAIRCFGEAIRLDPVYAQAHSNLGAALARKGKLREAEDSIAAALRLDPRLAAAHDALGGILWEQGRLDEALASTGRAATLAPAAGPALNHLGAMLKDLGRLAEAVAIYRRRLQITPQDCEALNGLADSLAAAGDAAGALDCVMRSLAVKETMTAKRLFAEIVRSVDWTSGRPEFRKALVRALREAWLRPNELVHAGARLLKQSPVIGPAVARAAASWPRHLPGQDLFGPGELAHLDKDELLRALLMSAHNADIAVERYLTMARRALLHAAMSGVLEGEGQAFHAALAFQCFLNDYVFFHDDEEIHLAAGLRDAVVQSLESGAAIAPAKILAVATYFPLNSLAGAGRLLQRDWPPALALVLAQHILEPDEEEQIRAGIPSLTPIEREVSRRVRGQYEENPYPRWINIPKVERPGSVMAYLSQKFPFAGFQRESNPEQSDILCACCGAGQMALEIAQSLKGQVHGVDLSLKSLGYAKRKAGELGISNIAFAQADVMELGGLARRFDLVECSGAMHYFADPFAGWRVLLSLLRPGGFMLLGLYSKVARRRIMAARARIAGWGYGSSADDIRRARQDLRDRDANPDPTIVDTYDFFGISTCRDLLFHVQEQQIELPAIAAFMKENGLTFLGFDTSLATLQAYHRRFPDDPAATNLANWELLENENPKMFARMYMMWMQKAP